MKLKGWWFDSYMQLQYLRQYFHIIWAIENFPWCALFQHWNGKHVDSEGFCLFMKIILSLNFEVSGFVAQQKRHSKQSNNNTKDQATWGISDVPKIDLFYRGEAWQIFPTTNCRPVTPYFAQFTSDLRWDSGPYRALVRGHQRRRDGHGRVVWY